MSTITNPDLSANQDKNFTFRRLAPLFMVQFLFGVNDNILRSAILVSITFAKHKIFGIEPGVLINMTVFLFLLPSFLGASYAGMVSDYYNKVRVIRWVNFFMVILVAIASIGLYLSSYLFFGPVVLVLGTLLIFLSPARFALIPEYFKTDKITLATGYIEMGAFLAIVTGQFFGGWAMSSNWINLIMIVLVVSSLLSLGLGFLLEPVKTPQRTPVFAYNPLLASWRMLRRVLLLEKSNLMNIHALSWFWALGLISSTEFSLFTLNYIGGGGHLFSMILGVSSIGIGMGSVICAKIAKGGVNHAFVVYPGLLITLVIWFMLFLYPQPAGHKETIATFIHSTNGVFILLAIFCKSLFAGFLSVTCYSELLMRSDDKNRSQVIASNNLMNSAYVLIATLVCTLLHLLIGCWGVILIFSVVNGLVFIHYALMVDR